MARSGASEHHLVAATDSPAQERASPTVTATPDPSRSTAMRLAHITVHAGRIVYLGVATGTSRLSAGGSKDASPCIAGLENLRAVVFVEDGASGKVLGAAEVAIGR